MEVKILYDRAKTERRQMKEESAFCRRGVTRDERNSAAS